MGTDRHSGTSKGIKERGIPTICLLRKMKTENEIKNILKKIRRDPKKERLQNKKRWYKVGKYLLQGKKIKIYQETKVSARRTYQYYSKIKGDWDGPSSRKLEKIRKEKFWDLLKGQEELEKEILLAFSNKVQSHVMEGHVEMEHMICHGSTEVQDVMCQQQSGDLKHMTKLEALLADWLGEGSAEAQGSAETQGLAV